MKIEIRNAAASDLSAALSLDRESFGPDAWTILDYLAVFSPLSGVLRYTALADGSFAGFAAAERDREGLCILTLAVVPAYRRLGIGRALLTRCLEGYSRSYLYVDCENQPAIALYEQEGFVQTGILPAYYINGHDARVYRKESAPRCS